MVERRRRGEDAERVPTISDLINQHRGDRSYRDLALRAEDAGYHIKFQTIADLAVGGPKAWPKNTTTIEALAAALEVNVQTVVLAFARSFGLDVGRSVGAQALTDRELLVEIGARMDAGRQVDETADATVTDLDSARSPFDPKANPPEPNVLNGAESDKKSVKRAARRPTSERDRR